MEILTWSLEAVVDNFLRVHWKWRWYWFFVKKIIPAFFPIVTHLESLHVLFYHIWFALWKKKNKTIKVSSFMFVWPWHWYINLPFKVLYEWTPRLGAQVHVRLSCLECMLNVGPMHFIEKIFDHFLFLGTLLNCFMDINGNVFRIWQTPLKRHTLNNTLKISLSLYHSV